MSIVHLFNFYLFLVVYVCIYWSPACE